MYRVFVVGCSRSGTTVLQRQLVQTCQLFSLPETDFFGLSLRGGLDQVLARFGVSRSLSSPDRAFDRLRKLLPEIDIVEKSPPRTWRYGEIMNHFVAILDEAARQSDEAGWLEKTPKHFRFAPVILRHLPDARILHVVRWGPDVVASILDRAAKYPDEFPRQGDVSYGIKLWNRAVRCALADLKRGRAEVVLYEDFAAHPQVLIEGLTGRLQLPRRIAGVVDQDGLIEAKEQWKAEVSGDVRRAESKFSKVLSSDEQRRVLRQLDLKGYERLAAKCFRPSGVKLGALPCEGA